MKIHAFNFTCYRDLDLSELMCSTATKHGPVGMMYRYNTDTEDRFKGYGNGSGWPQSMLKLNALREIVRHGSFMEDDFVLSVDSDVVFTSPEVFKYVKPEYGIIGIKHRPEYNTKVGKWSHMSGALIFLRGDIARRMAELDDSTLNGIRFNHFKPYNLTENEDVVLSYLANYVGASHFDLGSVPGLSSGDFESDALSYSRRDWISSGITPEFYEYRKNKQYFKSFYHLNYCPTQFLGEPVAGKWDIPRILKQKRIEL